MTNFKQGSWNRFVDVHDFILRNYTPYDGDESFLTAPTPVSYTHLWRFSRTPKIRFIMSNTPTPAFVV